MTGFLFYPLNHENRRDPTTLVVNSLGSASSSWSNNWDEANVSESDAVSQKQKPRTRLKFWKRFGRNSSNNNGGCSSNSIIFSLGWDESLLFQVIVQAIGVFLAKRTINSYLLFLFLFQCIYHFVTYT